MRALAGTVEHDLMLVRNELDRRGWVSQALLDLNYDEDEEPTNSQSCGACMTGAVGLVTEGSKFLQWAIWHADQVPIDWNWSRRGLAVFTALWENRPVEPDSCEDHIVNAIVEVNDSGGMSLAKVLTWIDRTIAHERGEVNDAVSL